MRPLQPASLILLGALACAGESAPPAVPPPAAPEAAPAAAPTASEDVLVRGVVRLAPELSFRPCDGGPQVSVLDSTGNRLVSVFRTVRAPDESGMYLVGQGAVAANHALILRDVEFAAASGEVECATPAATYSLFARGEAPAWRVTITDAGIEYADSANADGIRFAPAVPDDSAGWTRYRAGGAAGDAHTIELLVQRSGCAERSGASYGALHANVVIDGRAMSGCGWRGRLR